MSLNDEIGAAVSRVQHDRFPGTRGRGDSQEITRQAFIKPETLTCPFCQHTGADVHQYNQKVGGSDELVTITSCDDIDECKKRQEGEGK